MMFANGEVVVQFRLRRVTLVVSAVAGLMLTSGGQAIASTPQSDVRTPATASQNAVSDGESRLSGTVTATITGTNLSSANVITCTGQAQYPHKSSHVPGTVNVVATVSCTAAVTSIGIRAALYRNGALVKDSGAKYVYGTSFAQNNAAETCHNATYQGWMSFTVTFPPGYSPATGAGSDWGSSVSITC